jgi:acetyl-CoA carboxylase biotin carboxyl carrier protein
MDLDKLKALLALMDENDILELEIEEDDFRVRLKKEERNPAASGQVQVFAGQGGGAPVPAAAPAAAPAAEGEAGLPDNVEEFTAPLVGTFYRAAKPGAEAFVKEGDTVDADTTLCIIEAMKVMNEIKAECEGVISKILIENGESCEYGQPLFLIETR